MLKMTCSNVLGLTFIILMFIGTVKCRTLGLDSSSSIFSDGVDHDLINHENTDDDYLRMANDNSFTNYTTTMLYEAKRCESIYGFLPCADTMAEGVFLIITYTYMMMLGEEYIKKGSQALFLLFGDRKLGASVFRVLMAVPRIVLVVAGGITCTEIAAKNQVAFGVSMYAGSTLITLTLLWGFYIILSKDKLRGKEPLLEHHHHHEDPSTKCSCLPLKHKLSFMNDNGVNIDKETGNMAVIMLLSLIPFGFVQLAALIKSPITILLSLIISGVSLVLYFGYQIGNPWIDNRTFAYLRQEHLRNRFFYHVQKLSAHNLLDEEGGPIKDAFRSIFNMANRDENDSISREELEDLISNQFKLSKDLISIEYAKAEIFTHFDDDGNGMISLSEFEKGCMKWLKKWKNTNSNSNSKSIWDESVRKKKEDLTHIEKIMPKILEQLFEKDELVKDGKPDKEKIESLFSETDIDADGKIGQPELKKFIENFHFGISLDPNKILQELIKDFDENSNYTIDKEEFVDGFIRWIEKAISYDPTIKDPKQAIAKFAEDRWADIDTHVSMAKPNYYTSFWYLISGIVMMLLISGPFMQSVIQFSNAAHIPFSVTSFVICPVALNSRSVIKSLFSIMGPRVSKNASLTFSEIYNGLVMNNLLGLFTLLILVHMKGLSWIYSSEVLTIMIPCAVVGLFARKRDTYTLWASICAMLLYPIYDKWADIDTHVSMAKPNYYTSFWYLISGIVMMLLISGPFMQSVIQFSNAAHIPFSVTSFVICPVALNSRSVIKSLFSIMGPRVSKNASLTFSEIYIGLVKNNLLGLFTLLILVHMKGLSWIYSNEVLTIMIPCAVVGLFSRKHDTYTLWASICVMLLYPIYAYLFVYVL